MISGSLAARPGGGAQRPRGTVVRVALSASVGVLALLVVLYAVRASPSGAPFRTRDVREMISGAGPMTLLQYAGAAHRHPRHRGLQPTATRNLPTRYGSIMTVPLPVINSP